MDADRDRWGRMRMLFEGALATSADERAAYLERACAGDLALLTEVRILLDSHDRAGDFLESPALVTALVAADAAEPDRERHAVGVGDVVSHYRLQARLGAGGMGVVYLARDLALGRPAAVKILPDVFAPVLRRRLRAEAAACARLQHPAIATYYDSGDARGTDFIAMEFVPGRTLRERLRDGPLAPDEAVAIATCVLEGLSHAHAAGILHCDVKPENIVVTASRTAKLLDFGLAKTLASVASGVSGLTAVPAVAGTVGYMSPEQIRNEPLDVRSDLFQVGAVLYEMLSGRPAFPGATAAERLAAVLTRDPEPIDGAAVHAGLNTVLDRALHRDRSRRYPSAGALLSELLRIGAGGWSAALPDTLAVLDFRNLGGLAEDDWIGTGVTESVAFALRTHPNVILAPADHSRNARAASRPLAPEGTDAEAGLALGCRWVLTGHYRRLGPALRLTARIVETSTGRVVANGQLDGTLEQIFDLQDRIVATTCACLAVETAARPESPRTTLPAYECYARGRRLVLRRDRGAFDQAQRLFEDAVRLDPLFAHALAGLAQISAMRYTFTSDSAVLETAIGYARRAIEAAPALADAYIWLGYAQHRLGNSADADLAFARCRELDPREVFGYYFGVGAEYWRRDPDRSVALLQRAVELDPQFGLGWWGLGSIHLQLGRYPEASSCFERCSRLKALQDAATVAGVEGYWAESLRLMRHLDAARQACLAGLDAVEQSDFMYRDTNRVMCLVTLGRTAADQGDVAAARAAFQQAVAHVTGRPGTLAGGTLSVQALAGLAQVDLDGAAYDRACTSYAVRTEFNFSWLWLCDDARTCADLAAAARALGRHDDAQAFLQRATAYVRQVSAGQAGIDGT